MRRRPLRPHRAPSWWGARRRSGCYSGAGSRAPQASGMWCCSVANRALAKPRWRGACARRRAPYHTHSALYPAIEYLQRVMGLARHDTPEQKLDKLARVVEASRLPPAEVLPLFATLLAIPVPKGRYPAVSLTPQQQRQQTLDALGAWVAA